MYAKLYIYKGERNSKFGVLPTFTTSILSILVSQSRLEKGVDEEEKKKKKGTRVILIRTRRGVEVKAAFLFRASCWREGEGGGNWKTKEGKILREILTGVHGLIVFFTTHIFLGNLHKNEAEGREVTTNNRINIVLIFFEGRKMKL